MFLKRYSFVGLLYILVATSFLIFPVIVGSYVQGTKNLVNFKYFLRQFGVRWAELALFKRAWYIFWCYSPRAGIFAYITWEASLACFGVSLLLFALGTDFLLHGPNLADPLENFLRDLCDYFLEPKSVNTNPDELLPPSELQQTAEPVATPALKKGSISREDAISWYLFGAVTTFCFMSEVILYIAQSL